MKPINTCFCVLPLLTMVVGCASDPNQIGLTNQRHPGPAIGRTIGVAAGGVAGNAAGLAVGVGEGAVIGVKAPFDNKTTIVRRWKTVEAADGRVIQVPEDVVVDEYGRPVESVRK